MATSLFLASVKLIVSVNFSKHKTDIRYRHWQPIRNSWWEQLSRIQRVPSPIGRLCQQTSPRPSSPLRFQSWVSQRIKLSIHWRFWLTPSRMINRQSFIQLLIPKVPWWLEQRRSGSRRQCGFSPSWFGLSWIEQGLG